MSPDFRSHRHVYESKGKLGEIGYWKYEVPWHDKFAFVICVLWFLHTQYLTQDVEGYGG